MSIYEAFVDLLEKEYGIQKKVIHWGSGTRDRVAKPKTPSLFFPPGGKPAIDISRVGPKSPYSGMKDVINRPKKLKLPKI